jgi:hypothetical protein
VLELIPVLAWRVPIIGSDGRVRARGGDLPHHLDAEGGVEGDPAIPAECLADAGQPRNVSVRLVHPGEVRRGELGSELLRERAQIIRYPQYSPQRLPPPGRQGLPPPLQLADSRSKRRLSRLHLHRTQARFRVLSVLGLAQVLLNVLDENGHEVLLHHGCGGPLAEQVALGDGPKAWAHWVRLQVCRHPLQGADRSRQGVRALQALVDALLRVGSRHHAASGRVAARRGLARAAGAASLRHPRFERIPKRAHDRLNSHE